MDFGGQVDRDEAGELRALVARRVDDFAVAAERAAAIRHDAGRRESRLRARRHVDEPKRALVHGHVVGDQQCLVVGGPVDRRPPAALYLKEEPVARGPSWIHQIDVGVGAVAPRGAVGDAGAIGRPRAQVILALPVREQCRGARLLVEAIELVEFAAADVALDHEVRSRRRLVARGQNAIGEERQLVPVATGDAHRVRLHDVGEAGRDQHFAARRVPVLKAGAPELRVAADGFGDGRLDRRDAVDDEVFVRGDELGERGRRYRQTGDRQATGEHAGSLGAGSPKLSRVPPGRNGTTSRARCRREYRSCGLVQQRP